MEDIKLIPKNEIDSCANNLGLEYESKVTLLTSLAAVICFEEFEIKTNVKGYTPLDDICLWVKKDENEEEALYLFQLKHRNKPSKLGDSYFIGDNKKRNFVLDKYHKKYMELCRQFKKIFFIFYTNYSLDVNESDIFKINDREESKFLSILNTSKQCLCKLNENDGRVRSFHKDFIKNSYFFANQRHCNDIHYEIVELLGRGEFQISRDLCKIIIDDLLNYFNNICDELVCRPVITKQLVLRIVYFSCLYCRSISFNSLKIIKSDVVYPPDLWDFIKTDHVIIKKEYLESIKNMIFNHDLLSESSVYLSILFKHVKSIHQDIMNYFVSCCCRTSPFVIKEKYFPEVWYHVSEIMKFKVILISDEGSNAMSTLFYANFSLLRNIYNYKLIIDERLDCCVKDVVSADDLKLILNQTNISDLLEIFNKKRTTVKNAVELERFIYKIEIDKTVLGSINDLVVVLNCKYSKNDFLNVFNVITTTSLTILKDNEIMTDYCSRVDIIISPETELSIQDNSRCVHYIEIEDTNLYWRGSFGGTGNLIKFMKSADDNNNTIKLDDIPSYFKYNQLIVVSGVPGIGKSVAMRQLSKCIPPNVFVLLINLREKQEILLNLKESIKCLDFLRLINNETNSFYLNLFELKFKQKSLLIILDGYDEIAPKFISVTNKLIKSILKEDIRIILTTRSVLEIEVEKIFSIKSIVLKPFDIKEQSEYLEKYFSQNTQLNYYDTKNMCENIINKISNNIIGDENFNSVPLHLTIISDILLDLLFLSNFELSSIKIDKIKIYETFVKKKLDILMEKTKVLNIDEEEIREYHQNFALKEIFHNIFVDSNLDESVQLFSDKLKRGAEKTGILIDDVNDIFIHRTVAEYFTALWLINNFDKNNLCANILLNEIFKKEYYVVSDFFNSLLYNTTSAFKKITSSKFQEITPDEIYQTFKLGRNILHLLFLNLDRNKKSNLINKNLGLFLKIVMNKNLSMLQQKDMIGLRPLDYVDKIVEINDLVITMKFDDSNIYFHFNKKFNLLEFVSCKNINIINNSQAIIMDKGIDILIYAFNYNSSKTFNFMFLIENYDNNYHIYENVDIETTLLNNYKNGFEWLLEFHENINYLHCMAMGVNSLDLSCFLLEKKNDILDWVDGEDNPMHYACEKNLIKFITFFIDNGARLELNNSKGLDCFDISIKNGNIEILTLLLNKYEQLYNCVDKFINKVILNDCEEFINYLLKDDSFNSIQLIFLNQLKESPEELLIYKSFIKQETYDKNGNTILHLIILDKKRKLTNQSYNKNLLSLLNRLVETSNHNIKNLNGLTPFHMAVENNDTEIVKFLLNFNVNINSHNNIGDTALHTAVKNNSLEITNLLLSKNDIKINIFGENSNSPLMWAVNHENLEMVILLIASGVNINSSNSRKETALHWAVSRNKPSIAIYLLENNANTECLDIEDNTPIIWAINSNNFEMVQILINANANLNKTNKQFLSPLHWSVLKNDLEITKLLLQNGANVESVEHKINTPLFWAISSKNVKMVQLLIKFGANIHKKNYNLSALHWSIYHNTIEIAEILLSKGAYEADLRDSKGNTPLLCAVRTNNLEMVICLLEYGVNINGSNHNNETPLHWAVSGNKLNITQILLENFATVNCIDNDGNSPLIWAIFYSNLKAVKLLINFGANIESFNYKNESPLHCAVSVKNLEILVCLLENEAVTERWDSAGNTPLIKAVQSDDIDLVKALVKFGADIKKRNSNREGSLHYAYKYNFIDIAQFLLDNLGDDSTPYDYNPEFLRLVSLKCNDYDLVTKVSI